MHSSVVERARGRWPGILAALGVDQKLLNKHNQPCPFCGGKDRFRFSDRGGDGFYFCSKCGPGGGMKFLQQLYGLDYHEAALKVESVIGSTELLGRKEVSELASRAALNRLWTDSRAITASDPAGRYLARRVGPIPPPACLRFVPKATYQNDAGKVSYMPCMIAMIRDHEGKPCNLHRTFLSDDGSTPDIERPRQLMRGALPYGCAIRLGEPEDGVLGLAEGIETAMSAGLLFGIPCWATISEGWLKGWKLPNFLVSRVMIFADNDTNYVGQASAYELAKRLKQEKQEISVRVYIPPLPGADWNDVWQQPNESLKRG